MSKFEERVLDKLDAIQGDVTDLKVEQALQGKDIAKNTEDLKTHIEGVKTARILIKQNTDKINEVEKKVDAKPKGLIDKLKLNDAKVLAAYAVLIPTVIGGIVALMAL